MPSRYRSGVLGAPRSYYFSIGPHKYTVRLTPESCVVVPGEATGRSDVVLKTTEDLWFKLTIHGKNPGPIDLARGKFKTNDPGKLADLRRLFDLSPP